MSHTTTLTIDGSPVAIAARTPWPVRLSLRLRGYSTLTLQRLGVAIGDPDPYLGKTVELSIDGDIVFAGDVVDADHQFTEVGWSTVYQCHDLRSRGDRMPFTDSNTLGDYATYNYDPEDPDKIDARLGRTVGEILEDVLTMQDNADGLDALGIGGYTSLSPPTLPAATVADLAAMTVILPYTLRVGGEHMLGAIESFLRDAAPNHAMWVRPDGVIRFIDLRTVTENTITFGDCDQRVEVSGLPRSVSSCFQRVVVRGKSIALPKLLTLTNGGLAEKFGYGALSNSAAKAAWTPDDFLRDQDARSIGTCSCTDTTHVVLTSTPGTQTWASNEWDQSHRRGMLYVWSTTNTGYDKFFASRVVSNTSKSSGGTSTFTLETPLPDLTFDNYILRGISSGASLVWRLYEVVDTTIRAALARRFTYPVPYVNAGGSAASLTSYPQASVVWSLPGSTTPLEFFDPIVAIDLANGTFLLGTPTYNYSNAAPSDVRILAAVNTGVLTAVKPASGYEGTSHTVEGLENTLTITVDSWRDPANQANVEAYAQDQLDAVKDAMIDGAVTVHDLYVPGLTFGLGISIDAVGYTTGWESLNAPVVATDVVWNNRAASHYTTTMQVSSRRACYGVHRFLQPERRMSDGTMGFGEPTWPAASYAGDGGDGGAVLGTLPRGVTPGGWADPSAGIMSPAAGMLDPSLGMTPAGVGMVDPSIGMSPAGPQGGPDVDWSGMASDLAAPMGDPGGYKPRDLAAERKAARSAREGRTADRRAANSAASKAAAEKAATNRYTDNVRAASAPSQKAAALGRVEDSAASNRYQANVERDAIARRNDEARKRAEQERRDIADRNRQRGADRMLRGSVIDTSSINPPDWNA